MSTSVPAYPYPHVPIHIHQHHATNTAVGTKDTAPTDVYEVTYEEYVAPIKKEKTAVEASAEGGGAEK